MYEEFFNCKYHKINAEKKELYMLQAEIISNILVSFNAIPFSFINSARRRTLAGWHPLLKTFIRDEHAIESGWISFISISSNSDNAFSQFSSYKKSNIKFSFKSLFLSLIWQFHWIIDNNTCSAICMYHGGICYHIRTRSINDH